MKAICRPLALGVKPGADGRSPQRAQSSQRTTTEDDGAGKSGHCGTTNERGGERCRKAPGKASGGGGDRVQAQSGGHDGMSRACDSSNGTFVELFDYHNFGSSLF